MFSYYGAKTNVVQHYPPPKHPKVIEPFAGSARYSLKYFDRDILLVDKYEVIINIWKWLQVCSPNDILSLPRMQLGEKVDDFKFDCQEAKDLMGFMIGFPTTSPRKTVSTRMKDRPNSINYTLNRIAKNLFKIRHWDIRHGSYEDVENEYATYFIDPPYGVAGQYYVEGTKNMDFDYLANWCLTRNGQVIVCESLGATWLDFKPLVTHKVTSGYQTEVVYLNEASDLHVQQLSLF